ncbi:unnamed protein product [Closterium sp. NIES-54]
MAGAVTGVLCVGCTPTSYSPSSAAVWAGGPKRERDRGVSTGVVVGPVLAWAEPTSGEADWVWSADRCTGRPGVGRPGVVDTLEARLEDARRRHEANEYGPNLPLAVIKAGIRLVWAEEHPARRASPRPVNNEGSVDVGVNAGGDQVGNNAGCTSRQRCVIHADEVGGVQARGMRSSAAAGSSQGDVGGRRSSLSPMSATHVTAGGIASSYGCFKFMPDRISVIPLLVGQHDILTWKEAIEPQLEMAGLIGFARGTVATPEEQYPDLRAEFRADEAMQEVERPSMLLAQVNYVASVKQGGRSGQRGQFGGGGSSGSKPTKDADKKKSAKDSGRGGGGRCRECWLCGDPNHLSFECPDRSDSDDDNTKVGCRRSSSRRPRRGRNQSHKEKHSTKSSTLAKDADSTAGGKGQDDKETSCSLVGIVELTVSLAPKADKDFQAMAAVVQANPAVVMLHSGCSHHLMGTKVVFVDLQPSGDVKHVRGFNGALQDVQGRGTVTLQGEAGRQVLILDVIYVVALRAIVSATKSTPDRLHARLTHVGMNTIWRLAKHEVATGLDLKSASGANLPCVSCVGGKLVRHTFPNQGSDADDVLAVVHVNMCRPFRVAAKDGSLYFLLLKDRKTRYVWVRPVGEKSDVLQEFVQWLAVTERQTKKSVLMLRSDPGGEFLGKQFTDFMNGKGIVEVSEPAAEDVEDVPSPFPSLPLVPQPCGRPA